MEDNNLNNDFENSTESIFNSNSDNSTDHKADILCAASALLMYGPGVISAILNSTRYAIINFWCGSLLAAIGFVLMIVLRVKYPKHTGGKVLMWITIVTIVLFIIALIIFIITCNMFINSCCQGCD